MANQLHLDQLWNFPASKPRNFRLEQAAGLPDPARRYLLHAIASGTQLASAVRLRMHGQIKLRRWLPFDAEQVISWDRGMIWHATVRMHGIPIRGFDRLVNGHGAMRWRMFGIIPVMTASGPDITRSAAGRIGGESVWLPSVLCGDDVLWTASDSKLLHARFTVQGEDVDLELKVDDQGRLETVKLRRWGNPDGAEFHYLNFGGVVEAEDTFGGYTIPTCLRVGWHFGTDRFESEGEFFRVTVDDAIFR